MFVRFSYSMAKLRVYIITDDSEKETIASEQSEQARLMAERSLPRATASPLGPKKKFQARRRHLPKMHSSQKRARPKPITHDQKNDHPKAEPTGGPSKTINNDQKRASLSTHGHPIHSSMMLAQMQHVFGRAPWDMHTLTKNCAIRLDPSRTKCSSERPRINHLHDVVRALHRQYVNVRRISTLLRDKQVTVDSWTYHMSAAHRWTT